MNQEKTFKEKIKAQLHRIVEQLPSTEKICVYDGENRETWLVSTANPEGSKKTVSYTTCPDRIYCAKCSKRLK